MLNRDLLLKLVLASTCGLLLGLVISSCAPQWQAARTQVDPIPPLSSPTWESRPTTETALENTPAPDPTPTISPTPTLRPPGPTSSPTPFICRQTKGRILQDQVSTDLLRHPIDFRVYLPPCYDQEPERRYPVLYLLHGQSYNDDQWDRLGADEAADQLIYSGEAAPFIIVMPRYRIWFQPDEHNFGIAMVEVLIPLVDQSYRTLPERQGRAIGGLSMGAAWALHLGFSQWELFGAIGLHSLALFSIDSPRIPAWLDSIPLDQLPRIYIDIGDKDSKALLDSTVWFEETLTEKNIPHEWYLFSGYHEEKYWQEHTLQYIRWYTQEW
jgi:enterochelin esterase-like enzyme